eukprot:1158544-Pelagomonas_calceolata.AAC.3
MPVYLNIAASIQPQFKFTSDIRGLFRPFMDAKILTPSSILMFVASPRKYAVQLDDDGLYMLSALTRVYTAEIAAGIHPLFNFAPMPFTSSMMRFVNAI